MMPRIALLTPLPPARSGVADYSAETARHLARLCKLEIFSGNAVSALTYATPRFDRVISVLGNSPLHKEIYELAARWGGAVICHDARLMGLLSPYGNEYLAAMASRELGRPITAEMISDWAVDETSREASFLGGIAPIARPLIFHAPAPAALAAARLRARSAYLPFAIYRPFTAPRTETARREARAALGLPAAQKLIASFGFLNHAKAIPELLDAFAGVRASIDCHLVFVGGAQDGTQAFKTRAEALGLAPHITFGTGFTSEAQYRNYLLAADCGVQLRRGGPGNISGALQDCIAAGLPSVANDDLAENLAAPAYVKRISDRLDPDEIAQALIEVINHFGSDTQDGCAAYCAGHSMENYVQKLLEILEV